MCYSKSVREQCGNILALHNPLKLFYIHRTYKLGITLDFSGETQTSETNIFHFHISCTKSPFKDTFITVKVAMFNIQSLYVLNTDK
jgi:hypothetical protein